MRIEKSHPWPCVEGKDLPLHGIAATVALSASLKRHGDCSGMRSKESETSERCDRSERTYRHAMAYETAIIVRMRKDSMNTLGIDSGFKQRVLRTHVRTQVQDRHTDVQKEFTDGNKEIVLTFLFVLFLPVKSEVKISAPPEDISLASEILLQYTLLCLWSSVCRPSIQ
jgi:hypothetical protein